MLLSLGAVERVTSWLATLTEVPTLHINGLADAMTEWDLEAPRMPGTIRRGAFCCLGCDRSTFLVTSASGHHKHCVMCDATRTRLPPQACATLHQHAQLYLLWANHADLNRVKQQYHLISTNPLRSGIHPLFAPREPLVAPGLYVDPAADPPHHVSATADHNGYVPHVRCGVEGMDLNAERDCSAIPDLLAAPCASTMIHDPHPPAFYTEGNPGDAPTKDQGLYGFAGLTGDSWAQEVGKHFQQPCQANAHICRRYVTRHGIIHILHAAEPILQTTADERQRLSLITDHYHAVILALQQAGLEHLRLQPICDYWRDQPGYSHLILRGIESAMAMATNRCGPSQKPILCVADDTLWPTFQKASMTGLQGPLHAYSPHADLTQRAQLIGPADCTLTTVYTLPDGRLLGYHIDDWYALISTTSTPTSPGPDPPAIRSTIRCTIDGFHPHYPLVQGHEKPKAVSLLHANTDRSQLIGSGHEDHPVAPLLAPLQDRRMLGSRRRRAPCDDGTDAPLVTPLSSIAEDPLQHVATGQPTEWRAHLVQQGPATGAGSGPLGMPKGSPPVCPPPSLPGLTGTDTKRECESPPAQPCFYARHANRGSITVLPLPTCRY